MAADRDKKPGAGGLPGEVAPPSSRPGVSLAAESSSLSPAGRSLARRAPPAKSPAEERLKRAFLALGLFARPRCQSDVIVGAGPLGALVQQPPVSLGGVRFALDFAILQLPAGEFIGVEVDGFDHHDRTPEQAEHDRARDRALVTAGWVVLRFSAREVLRDADGCVREVLRFLRRASGVLGLS